MKAHELKKESKDLESFYKEIKLSNDRGEFKHFTPHFIYVDDSTKLKLIENEFKVYNGEWFGSDKGLIVEW